MAAGSTMMPASSSAGISFASAAAVRVSDYRHPRSAVAQKQRGRQPALAQADHQHPLVLQFHASNLLGTAVEREQAQPFTAPSPLPDSMPPFVASSLRIACSKR